MAAYFRMLCGTCKGQIHCKGKVWKHTDYQQHDHHVTSVVSVKLGEDT